MQLLCATGGRNYIGMVIGSDMRVSWIITIESIAMPRQVEQTKHMRYKAVLLQRSEGICYAHNRVQVNGVDVVGCVAVAGT